MQTRQTSPSTLKSAWRLDATDIGRDVIRIEGQAEPVCPFSVGGHETIGSIPQRLVRDVDVLPARDLVLLIRDEVSPLDFRALLWCVPDSEVGHEVVGTRPMPVPFTRWGVNGVAGTDGGGLTAPCLSTSDAFRDVQGLPFGMRVPRGASPWAEADGIDPDA